MGGGHRVQRTSSDDYPPQFVGHFPADGAMSLWLGPQAAIDEHAGGPKQLQKIEHEGPCFQSQHRQGEDR